MSTPEQTNTGQSNTVQSGTVESGNVESGTVQSGTVQTGTEQSNPSVPSRAAEGEHRAAQGAPQNAQPPAPPVVPPAPVPPQAPQASPAQQQPAPQPQVPQQPAAHAPAAQAVPKKKLSTFLKVSIILLIALTIASISLVFIGDFDGKVERIFSTFLLFAVFVLLTALDTSREKRSEWYAPVALIANAYILGLLLLVIWMTEYDPYWLGWEIFWKSLLVVVVVRVVILGAQLLLTLGDRLPGIVTRFAFITSVLGVLSGILFTAPVGIDAFDITIPELYWKIATATLILTALGLAITLLLRWAFRGEVREQRRAERDAQLAAIAGGYPQDPNAYRAVAQQPAQPVPPFPGQAAPAPGAPAQQELLPWPTFVDGTPLPAGPDGQPDFSVLNGR